MSNAQDSVQKVQDQALDAIRKTQDAVIETITTLTDTANKVTEQLPDFVKSYELPGFADLTKQMPSAADAIESNFAFAQQILTNQRDFAQRVLAATKVDAQ